MPKVAVVDMAGKQVGNIELAESVFGIEPNSAVMHHMVVSYLANQRQGTQSALTRGEVPAGGKSRGGRRERAVQGRVPHVPRSGRTAASFLRRSPAATGLRLIRR